jgi:hypothetical protein
MNNGAIGSKAAIMTMIDSRMPPATSARQGQTLERR